MQVVYLSHGGGPMPLLNDPGHRAMIDFMRELPGRLKQPDVVIVVSAHWEERVPTVLSAPYPPMYYDYYGFPPETYEVNYPAPGDPQLAERIVNLLEQTHTSAQVDGQRGFDHGHFIPMMLMYPAANIPTLQLSLVRGLDAEVHLELGKALRSLRKENILVIGSGFSFHNLYGFDWHDIDRADPKNEAFQDWLIERVSQEQDVEKIWDSLLHWEQAPNARYCHPREEHLLPLHVCMALGNVPAQVVFDDKILGKRCLGFLWE